MSRPRYTTLRNRSEGFDLDAPLTQAAFMLSHPGRAWALRHALEHGAVTVPDMHREFPEVSRRIPQLLLPALADAGWLRRGPYRSGTAEPCPYHPTAATLPALRALHAELTRLVELTEALEDHHDEPA